AELAVSGDDPEASGPAWETKAWREIRARVARRRAAREPVARVDTRVDAAPLPATLGGDTAADSAGGEGSAEEWLGAVQSSLTPIGGSPPAVLRVRLCYRKIGPARFIGTRELTTVFF